MKKKVAILLLVFFAISVVFAAPGSIIVYITKTGAKYHRDGCSSLKKSKISITLQEAVKLGYEPCKICNPPRLDQ
jgi:methylphosphotriester-DNA--protein-cysteine methyltransferase